jgi:hypothetical protein
MAGDKDPMLQRDPNHPRVNDKDHTVLYKSPGPHRGDKGRTYDFVQATTKEGAAGLVEEGWSETLEEAYELAGELKKARRRVAEDDEDEDADPITGEPAPAPAKKAKKKKTS